MGHQKSANLNRKVFSESRLSKCGNVKRQQIPSQQGLLPAGVPRRRAGDSSVVIIPGIRFPRDSHL